MSEIGWEDFDCIYSEPSQEYINQEIKKFEKIIEQFCKIVGINKEKIQVNFQTLKEVIIRVDMRRMYFRIFHSNMNANEYKVILGLECFWILKLRPFWIQIENGASNRDMQFATWINEKIVLHIVCSLLTKYNLDFIAQGRDIRESYFKELEYSFRYRDLSKESMYLMFDPFYFMCLKNLSVSENGEVII